MTTQHPAAPEGETDASGLTEAVLRELGVCEFRELVTDASMCRCGLPALNHDTLAEQIVMSDHPTIARLIERLRVVEGERDEWERLHGQQMTALDYWIKVYADLHEEWRREVRHCEHATARAESAEADRDLLMKVTHAAYVETGADTDGDEQWHCTPEWAGKALMHAVETLRKDYDDLLDEWDESSASGHPECRHDEDCVGCAADDLRGLLAGDNQ